jgi:hypothetical protein
MLCPRLSVASENNGLRMRSGACLCAGLVDVDVQTKTRQAQLAAKELLATEVEGKGQAETDEKEV